MKLYLTFFILTSYISLTAQINYSSIAPLLERGNIPGMSMAIVEKDNIQTVSFGWQNKEEKTLVNKQSIFQAASLSKPVVALLTMLLHEEGTLDLDQPLWRLVTYPKINDVAMAKKITPRMVLSHTTGMPNWGERSIQLKGEPGKTWGYSGEAFVWLSMVMEYVTDKSFEDLIQEKVLQPLEMNNSQFVWPADSKPKVAQSYDEIGQKTSYMKFESPNAAASLWTTAEDYGKFLQCILQKKLLKQFLWAEMLKPATSVPNTNDKLEWVLGLGKIKESDQEWLWHWGDNGSFKGFTLISLKNKKALVYFTNSHNGLSIISDFLTAIDYPSDQLVRWLDYPDYQNERVNTRKTIKKALVMNDTLRAVRSYKKYITSASKENTTSLLNNLFYSMEGYGLIERIFPILNIHLQLKSTDVNAMEKLAMTHTNLNDFNAASVLYSQLTKLMPEKASILNAKNRWLQEGLRAKTSKDKVALYSLYTGSYSGYTIKTVKGKLYLRDLEDNKDLLLSPTSKSVFEVVQKNFRLKFDWTDKSFVEGFTIHTIDGRITYHPKQK